MNTVILLAAGKSQRAGQNKLWVLVGNKPLWTRAYETFSNHLEIDHIVLVVPKGEELRFLPFLNNEKTQVVSGGETRMESFKRGLVAVGSVDSRTVVLDHNAANPFVTNEEISAVLEAAKIHGAAAVSHECVDTVLEVENGFYTASIPREKLRLMQTPQAVRGDILQDILNKSALSDSTDLSTALLDFIPVKILPAHPDNKKITTKEDLEHMFDKGERASQTFLGEDSHRFSGTGTLTLGGLSISDCPALEANSDGDIILHAIGRALAQAKGTNFSEVADPLMLGGNFDSQDYLEPLLEGISIQNISLSLEGSRPQIDPIAPALKSSLGRILQIEASQIHISAHTGEDLTPFGRGEGLRCLALVTLHTNHEKIFS
jgi:2-C-methyl-D-erythritol 4-phosphate cytidylyltransferase/2-C-methyl-D-erythritol 2,4-cyclodiphosphate synthase